MSSSSKLGRSPASFRHPGQTSNVEQHRCGQVVIRLITHRCSHDEQKDQDEDQTLARISRPTGLPTVINSRPLRRITTVGIGCAAESLPAVYHIHINMD